MHIPKSSVPLNFSLNIKIEIKTEKIISICPIALTSATEASAKAKNHPAVAPLPERPAGSDSLQYLKTEIN